MQDDEVQAWGGADGVGGLGGEVPLEDVFAEAEGDFCAVGDEFVEVGGGKVKDAFFVSVEVPDVTGPNLVRHSCKGRGVGRGMITPDGKAQQQSDP